MITLLNHDHRQPHELIGKCDMVFADPPDNQKLGYDGYKDNLPVPVYRAWLRQMIWQFCDLAPVVWLSFNSRWTRAVGRFIDEYIEGNFGWVDTPCVQVYTFGQHNQHFLGTNHRPLWLIHREDATFYPDAIRIESWRQRNGDKRADPRGRVPGDVFDFLPADWDGSFMPGTVCDFPRVTGNSKQRCDWHPTQLHKDMVARCINLCTLPGDKVFDPFAGTATTAKVCNELARDCVTCDVDPNYCVEIARELELKPVGPKIWQG